MKCTNCGFENEQGSFCVNCGSQLNTYYPNQATTDNTQILARQKIVNIAKDKLFLVICIWISAEVLIGAFLSGLDVVNLLITIFMWIIYSNAVKNIADVKRVRCISGTVYFIYIINYVAGGIVFLSSCLSAFEINSNEFNIQSIFNTYGSSKYYGAIKWIFDFPFLVVVAGIVISAIAIILNIFGWQNIHIFIKSVHSSASNNVTDYRCCRIAKNWLWFFGILDALFAIISIFIMNIPEFITGMLTAAVQIMGALLIEKHFCKEGY